LANTPYFERMLAIGMWFGRLAVLVLLVHVLVLAIAGSRAPQLRRSPGPGTLPTRHTLFVGNADRRRSPWFALVAWLTYLPAWVGTWAFVEHFTKLAAR
jgi:K+-transporting ATPase ATPase A chain